MTKLKSTTMWMSYMVLGIIALMIFKDASWAVGIGMVLAAVPVAYVTGNKVKDIKNAKGEQ